MNFPPSKRGCIFSFFSKSEGYEGKSDGVKGIFNIDFPGEEKKRQ